MTEIELSNHFRDTYKPTALSLSARRRLYGIGINDADYVTQPFINGRIKARPAYNTWKSVIVRSFSQDYKSKKPTYADVTCCHEWVSFMRFREWWLANNVDRWHLDKDLLIPNNLVYGPDTCIFVPIWLNSMLTGSSAQKGSLPIGVSFCGGAYVARCCMGSTDTVHIGRFKTPDLAHAAWRAAKLAYATSRKDEMDAIDERIYPSVVRLINEAK